MWPFRTGTGSWSVRRRMDRLIRMLLRVTRLDAGSVHFRKQKIYAADLVKNGLDHTQNGGHVTVS